MNSRKMPESGSPQIRGNKKRQRYCAKFLNKKKAKRLRFQVPHTQKGKI